MNNIPIEVRDIIKPDKRKEKKLITLMSQLDTGIISVKDGISKMIEALYLIERDKLYYYDGCGSMLAFINKNNYPERMRLSYQSIQRKLQVARYLKDNDLYNDSAVQDVAQEKLFLLATENVTDKDKILELSQYSQLELKKRLGRATRNPNTGAFTRADFEKKPHHKLLTWTVQIPKQYAVQFKKQFQEMVRKCKGEIV